MLNRHSNFVSHSGVSPLKRKPGEGVALLLQLLLLEYTLQLLCCYFGGLLKQFMLQLWGVGSLEIRITESSTPLRSDLGSLGSEEGLEGRKGEGIQPRS